MNEDDTYIIHGPPPARPLSTDSLGRLLYDSLISKPSDQQVLVDAVTGESVTYSQLLCKSTALATALAKHGYNKNTTVAVCSENSIYFYYPVLACFYIGSTVATLNFAYTHEELVHTLNISKPTVVFCSKIACRKFIKLRQHLNFIEKLIVLDSDENIGEAECLDNFIASTLRGFPVPKVFQIVDVDVDDQVAFILCSSGTTGLPKGVMVTHTNIHVRLNHARDPRYYIYSGPTNNVLGILPFFHCFGLITNLDAIIQGHKIVVLKRFAEELFLRTIETYRISTLWLVPPLAVFLAKSPLVPKYDLTCIKEITCGAAPLSKETEELIRKRVNVQIRQAYGQTEVTFAATLVEYGDIKQGSIGKVVTFMTCKIRDPDTSKSLGPGQIGELCLKGSLVMKGYCRNPEATKLSFTSDGWLRTGDLGYYDASGYFYIVDRLKELIKYKGFQVAPAELEAILLTHPSVKDVGVVGKSDDFAGELPLAFIVRALGAYVTEKELEDYVASKVSSQKKLRGGVVFVNSIPKNASGKILRRELRNLVKKYTSKL